MPFLPLFFLMAQGSTLQHVDVPILHRRPSRIAKLFNDQKGLAVEGVTMRANDTAGTITLMGPAEAISEMKTRFGLFDTVSRKVALKLRVESPLDHADWKADLSISNNSSWSGKDESTGTELAISARLNDDGTVTLFLQAKTLDAPLAKVVLRMKLDRPTVVAFVNGKVVSGAEAAKVQGPRVTITYTEREPE